VRDNYFFSNFLFLPVLVLLVLAILGVQRLQSGMPDGTSRVLRPAEISPGDHSHAPLPVPEPGPALWQLATAGLLGARLYQPVFVAMISLLAAFFQTRAALLLEAP